MLTKTYLKLLIAAGLIFLVEPLLQAAFNYFVYSLPFKNIPFPIRALYNDSALTLIFLIIYFSK